MTRKARRLMGGVALLASAAIAVTACSTAASGGGSSPAASAGSGGSGSNSAGVTSAGALLAKYMGEPSFTSPGPNLDASKVSGKSLFSIPANSSVAYVNTVDKETAKYAKILGIKYTDYTNQQQQSQWVQGVSQAVSTKADVLTLLAGLLPEQISPQLQQAQQAGVKVADVAERNTGQATPAYVNSYVFAPFSTAGQLMAAYATKATGGKADVLIISSNADISSQPEVDGITSELTKDCPGCKSRTINVNPTDWATKLQPTVESALSADPNINYVLPVYDSMAQFAAPAIQAAGKTGKTFIATFNGTPAILDLVRTGDVVKMDVADNTTDVALAGLDAAMRLMLNMPNGNQQIELRVFDKSNVSEAGSPAASGVGFGSASLDGYAKTWGVTAGQLGG
ncbi:MAG TPA: sugar ABC transporter substrate-binding protein [Pseudonocardiaceae bacterium]|nr:sugar ABC transporter substrate-binding protein [Pseudonocardiaceae bacterium]